MGAQIKIGDCVTIWDFSKVKGLDWDWIVQGFIFGAHAHL